MLSVDVPSAELSMESTKSMGRDGQKGSFLSTIWFSFMGMLFNLRSWFANWTSEMWDRLSATKVLQHPPFRPYLAAGTGAQLSWGPTGPFSQCNAQAVTSLGIPTLSCLINVLPVCLIRGSGSRKVAFQQEVMKRSKHVCLERGEGKYVYCPSFCSQS